jgi:hypothetical protein
MPRFYLHLCNGNGFIEDDEGSEFPDASAARKAAIAGLRDVTAGEIARGDLNLGSFIEIEDESGTLLATVHFSDAVAVREERGSRPSSVVGS